MTRVQFPAAELIAGQQAFALLLQYIHIDPPRTRTWNLRLRRPTPYPLGQRAGEGAHAWGWGSTPCVAHHTPGRTPVRAAHAAPHTTPRPPALRAAAVRAAVRACAGGHRHAAPPHQRAAVACRPVPCGVPESVVCVHERVRVVGLRTLRARCGDVAAPCATANPAHPAITSRRATVCGAGWCRAAWLGGRLRADVMWAAGGHTGVCDMALRATIPNPEVRAEVLPQHG